MLPAKGFPTFSHNNLSTTSIPESIDDRSIHKTVCSYVVLRRHRGPLLLRYWIHVVAILSTAGIATLNFFEVFLTDDKDSSAVAKLNAFQFVAKLHEAMLLGSLILIMMDAVRSKMLSNEGVSLGHFLSPFTFTNFDFLGSGQFWRSINLKPGTFAISLLLIMAIPFANVAGPLSAITIVPRLGWSRSADAAIFPHFFNGSASRFWPENLNATLLPEYCSRGTAGLSPGCPSIGLNQTGYNMNYNNTAGPLCLVEGFQSSCNVSVSSSLAANAITRVLSVDFRLDTLVAYASAPNSPLYGTIARKFEGGVSFLFAPLTSLSFIEADTTQLIDARYSDLGGFYKPAVAASCLELDFPAATQLLANSDGIVNWTRPQVTWINDVDSSDMPSFLFTYPIDTPLLKSNETCRGDDCFKAVACSVTARWSAHEIWYNTAQPGSLYTSDPAPRRIFAPQHAATIPVSIRKDWLDLISAPGAPGMAETIVTLINSWGTPRTREPLATLGPVQSNITPTNHSSAVAIIVAATITESLAQLPVELSNSVYNGNCSDRRPGFTFPTDVCDQTPAHWIEAGALDSSTAAEASMITFTVRRLGYGWFMLDSILIKIALAVLLVHALATTVYLLCVLVRRKTITTRWPSAAELVILAIDSFRGPELIGSTICVEDKDVWRKRVSLREVDYEDRLSLIVGDAKLYPERVGDVPMVGKKYR